MSSNLKGKGLRGLTVWVVLLGVVACNEDNTTTLSNGSYDIAAVAHANNVDSRLARKNGLMVIGSLEALTESSLRVENELWQSTLQTQWDLRNVAQVQLGMVAQLRTAGASNDLRLVRIGPEVQGLVTQVDMVNDYLFVNSSPIQIDSHTRWAGGIRELADLREGDWVQVSALPVSSQLQASFVQRISPQEFEIVTGLLDGVDSENHRVMVGGYDLDYQSSTLNGENFSNDTLLSWPLGQCVRLHLVKNKQNSELQLLDMSTWQQPVYGSGLLTSGIIYDLKASNYFRVGCQRILTDANTQWSGAISAKTATNGMKVRVEGVVNSEGKVTASAVNLVND